MYIDGQLEAVVISVNRETALREITHYAAMYIQEAKRELKIIINERKYMKNNIIFAMVASLVFTGCGPEKPECDEYVLNQKLRAERFDKCLSTVMSGRKGKVYTTNHDEDLEDVVSKCDDIAWRQAREKNPMCNAEVQQ